MKFTREDFTSPVWRHVKEYFEERLEQARKENDGLIDQEKTAYLRGRIKEMKSFLSLDQPKPMIGDEE